MLEENRRRQRQVDSPEDTRGTASLATDASTTLCGAFGQPAVRQPYYLTGAKHYVDENFADVIVGHKARDRRRSPETCVGQFLF